MSDTINVTVKALELFERWTGRQDQAKVKKDRTRAKALEALLAAVTETTAYTADRRDGGRRNRNREGKISQLWYRASIRVRSVDRRLSTILAMTSLGWADPELWDTPEFKNVPLGLDRIRKQCLWLLKHDE
ncbi:MAG: hypothetical protein OER22_02085 [Gammaproteobacteria bacterium]|nr:hypothetical protein [Gammaproteobacteria bacterium]MDH3373870.1 hypothetical protein [Gammaproteobacteria bacterium]MDH3408412.1 hypothetical protein [Gammaproteobacteria bacterium]MDH3551383.1 hypothetical protein [Gammaproteobacteria bacterium]